MIKYQNPLVDNLKTSLYSVNIQIKYKPKTSVSTQDDYIMEITTQFLGNFAHM